MEKLTDERKQLIEILQKKTGIKGEIDEYGNIVKVHIEDTGTFLRSRTKVTVTVVTVQELIERASGIKYDPWEMVKATVAGVLGID